MSWERINISKQDEREVRETFGKKARFLVDEDLDGELTEFLDDLGWNVKGVKQVGLGGRDDNDVLAFAWKQKRMVITNDTKFPQGRGFVEQANPGIIILPDRPVESISFARALVNALKIIGYLSLAYAKTRCVFNSDNTLSITRRNSEKGRIETGRYRLERNGEVSEWIDD
jgi:predicted nuclease of predicted toxin-antitoxin system